MQNITVPKMTKSRKIKRNVKTSFGVHEMEINVVDICNGNVILLSSEHFDTREEFMKTVKLNFPDLLDECKQRFKNDGKLDSETTSKSKRMLFEKHI